MIQNQILKMRKGVLSVCVLEGEDSCIVFLVVTSPDSDVISDAADAFKALKSTREPILKNFTAFRPKGRRNHRKRPNGVEKVVKKLDSWSSS